MYARLQKASEALSMVLQQSRRVDASFGAMATVNLNTQSLDTYLKTVFPDPVRGKDDAQYERAVIRIQRNREASQLLWESGKGNGEVGVKGTLWAAYNGVAQHADFGLTSARDSKWLDSVWFGESYRVKTRAFDVAATLVQGKNQPVGTA